ncbi:hypothetical protein ASD39_22570 [Sphingomonas sp. Root50]|nr:hypothetical protein ASD17_18670 [Sphingomonas sp. Root1294]KQY70668.1 hypothetical protein ASD39_22570 [Sphingomonas sp. Root50]KRB91840.1 hypothetical protein ASE22_07740 [Sphingomonas sp. Root720]
MKAIFAAVGLAVATIGMSGAAQARDRWDDHRWSQHDRRWDNGRHWGNDRHWKHDRRLHRESRWNRHNGRHARCWTEWRHHHRVRICR